MVPDAARLERLAEVLRELERRRLEDPLSTMEWLPGQLAFLSSTAKRKLLRAGVQAQGKTFAGGAETIWRARGDHPCKDVPAAPNLQWVVTATERQGGIVQRKVWDLLPKAELHPACVFDPVKGAFKGRYPKVIFRNGSEIEFRTGGGDPLNLASGGISHAWVDEPPENEEAYNELLGRLLRSNGDLSLTLTPWHRPCDWLREKCEAGEIEDLHFRLTPENLVFPGGRVHTLEDGTPCDQDWIDRVVAETSRIIVPVKVHGEWEFQAEGAYFEGAWDPTRMILDEDPAPAPNEFLLLGIDHGGDRPGSQCAHLMVVDPDHPSGHPAVHVLDEYVAAPGKPLCEDDARGILAMLKRNNLEWGELRQAAGDRAMRTGRGDRKSNLDLHVAIAKLLGVPHRSLRPIIRSAKRGEGRGAGSVGVRSHWLYQQMVRGCFTVARRCHRLIEALPRYVGTPTDPCKDPVDSCLYGCDSLTYGRWKKRAYTEPVRLW
jgi:hypothetical protein